MVDAMFHDVTFHGKLIISNTREEHQYCERRPRVDDRRSLGGFGQFRYVPRFFSLSFLSLF